MKTLPTLRLPKATPIATPAESSDLPLPKPAPIASVKESEARRFERTEGAKPKSGGSRLKRASLGERVTVYLPPKVAARIRRRCLSERRSLSDALTEAALAWLAKEAHDDSDM